MYCILWIWWKNSWCKKIKFIWKKMLCIKNLFLLGLVMLCYLNILKKSLFQKGTKIKAFCPFRWPDGGTRLYGRSSDLKSNKQAFSFPQKQWTKAKIINYSGGTVRDFHPSSLFSCWKTGTISLNIKLNTILYPITSCVNK